jgi:hypothetical protein
MDKRKKLENAVIGHALALTNYLVYIGGDYNRFQLKLIKACDELRKYLDKEKDNG